VPLPAVLRLIFFYVWCVVCGVWCVVWPGMWCVVWPGRACGVVGAGVMLVLVLRVSSE